MALDLQAVRSRAGSVYAGFTPGQRTITVLAVVGLIMGGAMFARWAATPTLVPLFTSLTTEDAAGITEALTAQGIDYELADGGSSILVPQADVYQLRVSLSAEGLPAGDTVGYDLLDDQGITTSEFRQRVDYQRALEGELSKTITSIEGVEAATVHVVIPEEDLFTDDAQRPTASVLVKTAADATIAGNQVQAIVNLVASSVEGLEPTQVTLADDKGNVLSAPGEDGQTMMAGDTQSQQTRAFETELSKSVEGQLAKIVGPGGADVEVRAKLNFNREKMISERYGKKGVALSTSGAEETYTGAPTTVGGVLGIDGIPTDTTETPGTEYEKIERKREMALDKVVREVTTAPGAVERLSVAVLLDDSVQAEYGTGQIERLVAAAAGLDPARGDTVEVTRIAFDRSGADAAQAELEKAAAEAKAAETMGLIRTAVVAFVILLVLALAYFSMRRATRTKATPVDVKRLEALMEAKQAEEQRQLEMLTDLPEVGPPPAIELPPEVQERVQVHSEIVELIDSQPDEVAQLLRGWLADRRG